ncbi:MAG: hypothetical protein IIA87_01815 [Nanoarchaeota archaeon]|nr:hypothetical protein [Nanoarchaeota archaeon]
MNISTITLDRNVKAKLDRVKSHPRESYNDVLMRILSGDTDMQDDSLYETIEILSDPDVMASLAKSIKDMKKGKLYSIDEV